MQQIQFDLSVANQKLAKKQQESIVSSNIINSLKNK